MATETGSRLVRERRRSLKTPHVLSPQVVAVGREQAESAPRWVLDVSHDQNVNRRRPRFMQSSAAWALLDLTFDLACT